jgi:hypothetical protein
LLCERPFALTVSLRHRRRVCAFCLADSLTDGDARGWSLRCERCKVAHFCSERCERSAALDGSEPSHGPRECAALAACGFDASGSESEAAADLTSQAIRILCHRAAGVRVDPFADTSLLQVGHSTYKERLHGILRDTRGGNRLKQSATAALRALPEESRVPPEELVDLLNRHQANVFGVLGHGRLAHRRRSVSSPCARSKPERRCGE